MVAFLRLLQMLTMVIWVGGLVFFAFVLAPTAFHTLPSIHEAGLLVGAALRVFDWVALTCGAVFIATLAASAGRVRGRSRIELPLVAVMVLLTAYVHWSVVPTMERDRGRAGGDINTLAVTDESRVDFDRLHTRSERVEGTVLLLGLGVVFLLSRERVRLV